MAVEVKRHHRHGRRLLLAGLVVAIGLGCLQLSAPSLSAQLGRALVHSPLQVSPSGNGLASLRLASHQGGVGTASEAGQRAQLQFSFESSLNQ